MPLLSKRREPSPLSLATLRQLGGLVWVQARIRSFAAPAFDGSALVEVFSGYTRLAWAVKNTVMRRKIRTFLIIVYALLSAVVTLFIIELTN